MHRATHSPLEHRRGRPEPPVQLGTVLHSVPAAGGAMLPAWAHSHRLHQAGADANTPEQVLVMGFWYI